MQIPYHFEPTNPEVVFGGVKINPQIARLKRGCDILVATPGRLLDLHQQGAVAFDALDAAARLSEKTSPPRNTKADGMAPIPGITQLLACPGRRPPRATPPAPVPGVRWLR